MSYDIADDRLDGAAQIGKFIGTNTKNTFYLLERGLVPCGKIGPRWVASKSALTAHFRKVTGATDDRMVA
jgi:hypothetical protein